MFTIEATTIVDAPPEIVWSVLITFSDYDQWSTMLIPEQSEPPRLGETIKLRLSMPGGLAYSFEPDVIMLDTSRHFAWVQKTGLKGLFDGEHHFVLTDLGEGQTELYNYEHYSGLLSPIFKRLPFMKDAPKGFVDMNNEIKLRAEALNG